MASLLDKSLSELARDRKKDSPAHKRQSSGRKANTPYARPSNDNENWSHDLYDDKESTKRASPRRAPSNNESPLSRAAPGTSEKLVVTNLHYDVSERELEALFGQIGPMEDRSPSIRFDKSGRSEGTAYIIYKDPKHAQEAKKQFDGANAKGQPISITFDTSYRKPVPAPELLSRLQNGHDLFGSKPSRGRGSRSLSGSYREPTEKSARGGTSNGRGGRGGGRGQRSTPKTAEDLDKELENFMKPDVEMGS